MGRTILTHTGTIPEGSGWDLANSSSRNDRTDGSEVGVRLETKTSGERRYYKWCLKYKPERCHHCSVCNLCFLRMDHHCPWVYDCIGFGNHKYFVLLLIYAELYLLLANITMFELYGGPRGWTFRVPRSLCVPGRSDVFPDSGRVCRGVHFSVFLPFPCSSVRGSHVIAL